MQIFTYRSLFERFVVAVGPRNKTGVRNSLPPRTCYQWHKQPTVIMCSVWTLDPNVLTGADNERRRDTTAY